MKTCKTDCLKCGRVCSVDYIIKNKGQCPYYCPRVSVDTVAKILNIDARTVERWDAERIVTTARKRGFFVIVYEGGKRRQYYGGKIAK